VLVVCLVSWSLATNWTAFVEGFPELLPWLLVVVMADLLPVPIWGSVELMMSFPVLLALAFVFPPYAAGVVGLVGTFDLRELRREISLGRGLFNRSNVALSVLAASAVFHELAGDVRAWPGVLVAALAAMIVDLAINATLVILGTRLLTGEPVRLLARHVYGGRQPAAFVLGYTCFGLLAVLLATVYVGGGSWALVAFAIPLLLARQMFVYWKGLGEARVLLGDKQRLITHVSSRIAEERRDERLSVAAGIHDEILPPLYQVHLMGQVLRQDLASGRLLDLEADIPSLLHAVDTANLALRDLIGDLRQSTLGAGGLNGTLLLLARSLETQSAARIVTRLEDVPGTPLTQLLVYQVAREALSNAVRHSGASSIEVHLQDGGDCIRLVVADDGNGFDPLRVEGESHFGLLLMRERVEIAGGDFFVDARPGFGTRVLVRVPVDRLGGEPEPP